MHRVTDVELGNEVSYIGNYAFRRCNKLASIVIGNGITNIGTSAFDGSNALSDVYYAGVEEDWSAIVINSNNTNLTNATIHYNYEEEQ